MRVRTATVCERSPAGVIGTKSIAPHQGGSAPHTLPALLALRAEAEPERVGLGVAGKAPLSFGSWVRRADAVAAGLTGRGVERGAVIALLFADDEWDDYAVGCLGVQRAGMVAVPLLSTLAPTELAYVLEDCGAAQVIRGREMVLPAVHVARAASLSEVEAAGTGADPGPMPEPGELAQIIYTSGTTGRPKGVGAVHANLAHGHGGSVRQRALAHSRQFAHSFPIGTNAGQTMLVNALTAHAGALSIPDFEADRFAAVLAAERVGTVFVVPAMAIEMVNMGVAARHDLSSVVLFGSTAAALPPAVATALRALVPNAMIVNTYTSTEAAPASLTMVVDPERPGAIGRPASPGDLRIIDQFGAPSPAGEIGEVWLRSPSVPRFYLGDPGATARAFTDDGWTRMGDLGRVDAEGYLHLSDRADDAIKTGASKVSTLKVEAMLHEHPAVVEAAVIGLAHPVMGKMVAAAVVVSDETGPPALRAHCRERLARHECPTRIVLVESLPHNASGKIVKAQLAALFEQRSDESPVLPATPSEVALAEIWERVLGVPGVSAGDDFFALGGDSLRAAQVATVVGEELGLELSVGDVFEEPGLAEQAALLERAAPALTHAPIADPPQRTAAPVTGDAAPLSAQQEDFLIWIHETSPPRDTGAISVAIRVRDTLDPELLRRALTEVCERHDCLRTGFDADPAPPDRHGRLGVPSATLRPAARPAVAEVDAVGGDLAEREHHATELALAERNALDDVTCDPLVRLLAIRIGEDDHVLVLGVHHIVFDGWSMGVLLRELSLAYSALGAGHQLPLPEPELTYAAYCEWARAQWPRTRAFWERELAGAPSALRPFPGRGETVREARHPYEFELDPETGRGLAALARARDASGFMAVSTCWSAVLANWSGARDLVLMTAVPGRTRPEHEQLIGCLVQSLLIRVDAGGRPSFGELLERVRWSVLAGLENQFYPYHELRPRVPHSARVYYEAWNAPPHFPGRNSEAFQLPHLQDLDWVVPPGETDEAVPDLMVQERPDGSLSPSLLYNRHAFEESTIAELAQRFAAACRRALDDPWGDRFAA